MAIDNTRSIITETRDIIPPAPPVPPAPPTPTPTPTPPAAAADAEPPIPVPAVPPILSAIALDVLATPNNTLETPDLIFSIIDDPPATPATPAPPAPPAPPDMLRPDNVLMLSGLLTAAKEPAPVALAIETSLES